MLGPQPEFVATQHATTASARVQERVRTGRTSKAVEEPTTGCQRAEFCQLGQALTLPFPVSLTVFPRLH